MDMSKHGSHSKKFSDNVPQFCDHNYYKLYSLLKSRRQGRRVQSLEKEVCIISPRETS